MKGSILFFAMLLAGFQIGQAAGPTCFESEEMAAESESPMLRSWSELYKSFRKYGHCDKDLISDGYSDSVVTVLVTKWTSVSELKKLVKADSAFHKFVFRHIDSTVYKDDLKKISTSAKTICPTDAKQLCLEIKKAADKAYAESRD